VIRVRRLLWLSLSAAVIGLGALVVRRLARDAGGFSPKGLADSAGAALAELSAAAQGFATDVRQGMAEHEATLREAAELDGGHLGRPATP
jgi:hypothetical protein